MKSIVLFLLLLASTAHAGWSSGGGELVADSRNPWFLKNVSRVHYCVEIDEANFGQTRPVAERLIRTAIDKWKLEFKNQVKFGGMIDWGIGTQEFTQVPCSDFVDLRFQLGTLTGDQMRQLNDPKGFIGITIRTDYDKTQMRGNGFIYIAPARGPLKPDRDGLLDDPWARSGGGLLYLVVLHELGHVFGVPHEQNPQTLMGERFVEVIMTSGLGDQFAVYGSTYPQPSIFKFHGISAAMICVKARELSAPAPRSPGPSLPTSIMPLFFGLSPEHSCQSFSLLNDVYTVMASRDGGRPDVIGAAKLQRYDGALETEPAFHIWLPKEQIVFNAKSGRLAYGPMKQKRTRFKGKYKTTDGLIEREMFVVAEPARGIQVGGVMDGVIYTSLFEGF